MYFGLIKFGKIATFSISNWGKITIMKILTFEFDHILYFQQFWKDFADLEHCKKKIFFSNIWAILWNFNVQFIFQ